MAKTKTLTKIDGELWRLKPNPIQKDEEGKQIGFKPWRIEIGGRASDGVNTYEGVSASVDLGPTRDTEYTPKERHDIIKNTGNLNTIMANFMKTLYLLKIEDDLST